MSRIREEERSYGQILALRENPTTAERRGEITRKKKTNKKTPFGRLSQLVR